MVLCDHFMESCAEAATALNIPYIITSTLEFTGGKKKEAKKKKSNENILIFFFFRIGCSIYQQRNEHHG